MSESLEVVLLYILCRLSIACCQNNSLLIEIAVINLVNYRFFGRSQEFLSMVSVFDESYNVTPLFNFLSIYLRMLMFFVVFAFKMI